MVSPAINERAVQQDVAAHMERNATLVQQIKGRGGDTQRERNIDCFVRIAARHDALFDGWGTPLDELPPTI